MEPEKEKEISKINDPVNHPAHYTYGKFETIDVITDWQLGFELGNTVKYISRSKHKNSELQDLEKSRWYLDHYITRMKTHKPIMDQQLTSISKQNIERFESLIDAILDRLVKGADFIFVPTFGNITINFL